MRETSKLFLKVSLLITTCLLIAGASSVTASVAQAAGKAHHHDRKAARKRVVRSPGHRVSTPVKHAARTRAPAPKPVKVHTRPARERAAETPAPVSPAPVAAMIANVLATACQNTEITPEPANIAIAREAVLCLVNRERAEHSVPPLKLNTDLQVAAEDHNAEMLEVDYFAHVAPDGETPVERIEKTGYIASESNGYVIGENLAWGTYTLSTPKAIVEAWIASPGHLANILEARYVETGIGIVPSVPSSLAEGNPGATYAQEFGVIVK